MLGIRSNHTSCVTRHSTCLPSLRRNLGPGRYPITACSLKPDGRYELASDALFELAVDESAMQTKGKEEDHNSAEEDIDIKEPSTSAWLNDMQFSEEVILTLKQ